LGSYASSEAQPNRNNPGLFQRRGQFGDGGRKCFMRKKCVFEIQYNCPVSKRHVKGSEKNRRYKRTDLTAELQ